MLTREVPVVTRVRLEPMGKVIRAVSMPNGILHVALDRHYRHPGVGTRYVWATGHADGRSERGRFVLHDGQNVEHGFVAGLESDARSQQIVFGDWLWHEVDP